MRIKLNSILVNDQERALAFYTDVLGFVKKMDIPMGEFRWLTVVSPEGPDDLELVLEPSANPIGATYQQGLFASGIPATAFEVSDMEAEYQRLLGRGVRFAAPPAPAGPVMVAAFDDTCGNLIQLYQILAS